MTGAARIRSVLTALLLGSSALSAQSNRLTVFNAGSLGPPFKDLLDAFARAHPGLVPAQENSPSIQAVRKMTELDRTPDVLATADVRLFPKMVVPKYAAWYVEFGSNKMVLAYGPKSRGAGEITRENWWRVLLRPGVRTGRSEPNVDPSGYRALLVMQLAERFYREPGLAGRLLQASNQSYVRNSEADLSALISLGELDYAWTYESLAKAHHLSYLSLPSELDLSDPARADWYANVSVRISGGPGKDSLTFKGEPIVFAVTVPEKAPRKADGEAFVRFLLSAEGTAILRATGFTPLTPPRFVGTVPATVQP